MNHKERAEWAERRLGVRRRMMGIMRKLWAGEVTEHELAQLQNYVAVTLTLMGKVHPHTWSAAKKEAEIAALIKGEVEDWDVVSVQTLEETR